MQVALAVQRTERAARSIETLVAFRSTQPALVQGVRASRHGGVSGLHLTQQEASRNKCHALVVTSALLLVTN